MQRQVNYVAGTLRERERFQIERHTNETRQLWRVLETHLENVRGPFLVGLRIAVDEFATTYRFMCSNRLGIEIDRFLVLQT